LRTGGSGSQGVADVRDLETGRVQRSQGFAANRKHFAASLLHGSRGDGESCGTRESRLRVVDGGRDALLTVREVAARLGVCTATVYTLCERGLVRHARVLNAIRVAPADLAVFIRASASAPTTRRQR
jgi:hypothetical protein